ncbi:MAG TPA: LCP family protein [Firmicutes bacterium]|nr:LCP family protein [Bacillota bacterium]
MPNASNRNGNGRGGGNSRNRTQPAKKAAPKAGTAARTGNRKRKKNDKTRRAVLIAVLVTIIVAVLIFLIFGIVSVYRAMVAPEQDPGTVELTQHTTTPAADQDKVAYYVLGILGEDEEDAPSESKPLEALSILCWDKQKETVNILQLPKDTYYGGETAKRITEIWSSPTPLNWCETCRKQLSDEEIADGRHTVCGTTVTQKKGSASQELLRALNAQLGLPVDGYFLIPQEALVKLVNLLRGVDVNLESALSVGEVDYPAGVQTLDGEAAVYYAMNGGSGVDGDINRMLKQRQVLLGVFQRLVRQTEAQLSNDSLGPLMNGSTPILSDHTRQEMIDLLLAMKDMEPASMTAYILPGGSVSQDGGTYFAPNRAALAALVNEAFNPYGGTVQADALELPAEWEGEPDSRRQVLSEIAVQQSGAVATTTTEGATTTAAA